MSKEYVDHALIEDGEIEKRLYQEKIFHTTVDNNTLVVLPTGMGKTASALLLAAHRLNERGGKVLFLAPTRPLVEQHRNFFDEYLEIGSGDLKVLTGKTRPDRREKEYDKGMCFFATPQVIQNDTIANRLDLDEFSLVVFDECHRATGDYPYSFIAEMYRKRASDPRILGITASPGGSKSEIKKVMENLFLDEVEIRTEEDGDVRDYTKPVETQWKKIELPEEFKEVKKLLEKALEKRTKKLKKWDLVSSKNLTRKDLLKLQGKLRGKLADGENDKKTFAAISKAAETLKIEHGLMLLETQGTSSLYKYMKRVRKEAEEGKTKAAKTVMNDAYIETAFRKTGSLLEKEIEHPKLRVLHKILKNQHRKNEDFKAIVFSHYRDQVEKIREKLEDVENCEPVSFVGQAGDGGLSQKEQVGILEKMEEGKYNTLIATAVGEEGLDIPEVDLVLFYEPIPSEIRAIQRRGRTGRQKSGRVMVLMAEDTRDEAYYWKAKHRERRMKDTLKEMKNDGNGEQKGLEEF